MKYSGYLLLSDLDGTLFDGNCSVSAVNKEAIRHFVAEGGRFGISTGRTQDNAMRFLDGVEINTPCILYNGSALYDFGEKRFLKTSALVKTEAQVFVSYVLHNYPEINIQVYTEEGIYLVSPKKYIIASFLADHQPCSFAESKDLMNQNWLKVLMCCEDGEVLRWLRSDLDREGMLSSVHTVFSSDIYLEFLLNGVSKGSMLEHLRKILSEEHRIIYAIGDYNNDIELLQHADVGVAPANALPQVKEIADVVTVSNEEHAIAAVIQQMGRERWK